MTTDIEREVFGSDFTDAEIDDMLSWDLDPSIEGYRTNCAGIANPVTWRFHGRCGDRIHISYQHQQSIYDAALGIPKRDPYPVSLMAVVDLDYKNSPDMTCMEDYEIAGRLLVSR